MIERDWPKWWDKDYEISGVYEVTLAELIKDVFHRDIEWWDDVEGEEVPVWDAGGKELSGTHNSLPFKEMCERVKKGETLFYWDVLATGIVYMIKGE